MLDNIAEPTDADLAGVETPSDDLTVAEWAALLDECEPVVKITAADADEYWHEDDNVHDDRYDGGIPSWSAWA